MAMRLGWQNPAIETRRPESRQLLQVEALIRMTDQGVEKAVEDLGKEDRPAFRWAGVITTAALAKATVRCGLV